ncbi:hypothetical protein ACVI1N_000197 [Sinorhizobium medicae]
MTEAPAEVPAITPPLAKISCTRSEIGFSAIWLVMRNWSPPEKKTALTPSSSLTFSAWTACSRSST